MKYNKSEIMKRAWEIKRSRNITMSAALKESWALAKKPVFGKYAEIDGFVFTLWEKYGKRRIYINNCTGSNKTNKGGYIDLQNDNSICATGCVKGAALDFLNKYIVA